CESSVEPTTSVNRIVALSVLKNYPPAWEHQSRSRPERPAQGSKGGHFRGYDTPHLGASRRSRPARKCQHGASLYIHLARCTKCRSRAPSSAVITAATPPGIAPGGATQNITPCSSHQRVRRFRMSRLA